MADTDSPETDAKKPVTRRRAPRKTSVAKPKPVAAARTAKPPAPSPKAKPVAATAPAAVEKPTAATARPAPKATKPAPKPRSTKRSTPRPVTARKVPARQSPAPVATVTEKIGGKWGAAAIAGGVAMIGAAAALLSLRGSTPKAKAKRAHQADGAESSKSFEAGIADEGTMPE